MTLSEGATHEIVSRWAEHRQRNCALVPSIYGGTYCQDMAAGIQLVRAHHDELEAQGETIWSIPQSLSDLLDDLANEGPSVTTGYLPAP